MYLLHRFFRHFRQIFDIFHNYSVFLTVYMFYMFSLQEFCFAFLSRHFFEKGNIKKETDPCLHCREAVPCLLYLQASVPHRDPPVVRPSVQILFYADHDHLRRKQVTDPPRPFDQADAVPVDVLIEPDFLHLFRLFDPVYIKMVEGDPSLLVDLQDREGRAVHRLLDTESLREPLCKDSLSCAEVADQGIDLPRRGVLPEEFSNLQGLFWTIGLKYFFQYFFSTIIFL